MEEAPMSETREAVARAFKSLYYNSELGWFQGAEEVYTALLNTHFITEALVVLRTFWRGY